MEGIMGASTMVLIVVFPINLALNILLIHYTSLGILGAPLAVSFTYWLCFAFLGLFTTFSTTHRSNGTWGGYRLQEVLHLQSCYEFLKLALPGILMVGTEWLVNCKELSILVTHWFSEQGCLRDCGVGCRAPRGSSPRCSVRNYDH